LLRGYIAFEGRAWVAVSKMPEAPLCLFCLFSVYEYLPASGAGVPLK